MLRMVLCLLGVLAMESSVSAGVTVTGLMTEYLNDPLGIDERSPGFSWRLESPERGVYQTAYQIQVASSRKLLASGEPDMWDSGKIAGPQSVQIRYAGRELHSRTPFWWRVRAWDGNDRPTSFSLAATFETALLDQAEWKGSWISVREAAGGNGYHSQFADSVDTVKWVQVDLGKPRRFNTVVLYHARPYNWKHDVPGFGFPVRYRIEASDEPEFASPRTIADRSHEDQWVLPIIPVTIPVGDQTARYVRVVATRLQHPKDTRPLFALAEIEILNERSENIALDAPVTALDSIEEAGWGKAQLTDGGRVSREPGGSGQILRREFMLTKPVASARAYVTGLGYYELRLNGKKVGDRVLDPPYTSFEKRVYYSTYDVTKLLKQGANCAGAMLGQGWWRRAPQFKLMLEVTYKDGTRDTVVSDGDWRWESGPIIENSIYHGEKFDARLEPEGWDTPGFDDSKWRKVSVVQTFAPTLSAQMIQPMKVTQVIRPKVATNPRPGVWVYDFGQNFSGWCRLRVCGPAGAEVKLRHAEMVYSDGTVNQENLRSARATDTYILKGQGTEVYEPRFTYHGFRYVQLEGFPGRPDLKTLEGRVVHTSFEQRGSFQCSNQLINQIQHACVWGEKTNFHSVPTDCPQRDERQGWMGDAWVSAPAMLRNFDMPAAYSKFLLDIQDAQGDDGRVPDTVPHVWGSNPGDPMWSIAYPLVLWHTYLHTGDASLLERHYDGVKRYLESLRREAGDSHIITRNNYGDWIAVEGTPNDLVSTGSFCLTAAVVADVAEVLGKQDDAAEYRILWRRIGDAFNARFLDPSTGVYGNGSQLSYAMPLYLGIAPAERHEAVLQALVKKIADHKGHLSTGFVGTPFLMDVLVREGKSDLAYTIATQPDYPGWGYMIANGATTIWELWELKTGNAMNSHNHPALGFVSAWFHEVLAGISIDPASPGWKRVIVRPRVLGDLKWAKSSIETIRGKVVSDWSLTDEGLSLAVTIPAGATGIVHVPKVGKARFVITEGGKIVYRDGIGVKGMNGVHGGEDVGDSVAFEVESGSYVFELVGRG